jgi:hypothetical protein
VAVLAFSLGKFFRCHPVFTFPFWGASEPKNRLAKNQPTGWLR